MDKTITDDLLSRIMEQEKTAQKFGFYWESLEQLLEQIKSECDEIKEAWQKEDKINLKEEIGDVMSAAISLSIFCNLDPIETLGENVEKFQKRYDVLVNLVKQDGFDDLVNQPMEKLLDYWHKAKKKTNNL